MAAGLAALAAFLTGAFFVAGLVAGLLTAFLGAALVAGVAFLAAVVAESLTPAALAIL